GEARCDVLARLEDLKRHAALMQMGCGRQADRACADHNDGKVVCEHTHGTDLHQRVARSWWMAYRTTQNTGQHAKGRRKSSHLLGSRPGCLMLTSAPRHRYTLQDYLDVEEMSEVRHEYFGGEIYAMAGGTPQHAALSAAVIG